MDMHQTTKTKNNMHAPMGFHLNTRVIKSIGKIFRNRCSFSCWKFPAANNKGANPSLNQFRLRLQRDKNKMYKYPD